MNSHEFPHLKRILPPSQTIVRQNKIHIDAIQFSKLLNDIYSHPQNLEKLLNIMDKIRLAVQSNLGLSATQREKHESHHPIWIKKGKPHFPVDAFGKMELSSIFYSGMLSKPHSPKVQIIKDDTDDVELSLLYQTKFRSFSLHIKENGAVTSSLKLNWQEIYDDLAPSTNDGIEPLRSFTPWQRHSESNFFNGRSTSKILTYLTSAYPEIFSYDVKSYYQDHDSQILHLNRNNLAMTKMLSSTNICLTLDSSLHETPKETPMGSLFAIIKRKSPLLGNLYQLAPALYRDRKIHIVLHGHQNKTEIQKIIHCDFKNENCENIPLKNKIILTSKELKYKTNPIWKNLRLLKHDPMINHVTAAPMVRASDPVMRKYWSSHFAIPVVYTEMITIADIYHTQNNPDKSPQEILEKFYYSDEATSSFRRLCVGEDELQQVKNIAFQIAIPHESAHADFFWGKNGENIARTIRMSLKVIFAMVPKEFHAKIRFAVNMCCPAASIEKMGAGFGLRYKPEYIAKIISTLKKEYPELFIEFKTLMLSEADKSVFASEDIIVEKPTQKISFHKNKELGEGLSALSASSLVFQGKPRNEEIYDLKKTLDITQASRVGKNFKFGFSGMVAALHDSDLMKIGYSTIGNPHYSVESILKNSPNIEVMLGRVLLGSAWLLLGRYANDHEILLMTLLQSLMLQEFSIGFGACGMDLMQIQLLYNLRHIMDDDLRNSLIGDIFNAYSSNHMIKIIHQACVLFQKDHELNLLKPFILRLKNTIEFATAGNINLYSENEKNLAEHVRMKALK